MPKAKQRITTSRKVSSCRSLIMRCLIVTLVAGVCLGAADSPSKIPLSDSRYSVHTLVREDIFAGILEGDMDRFARGEQSIDFLMLQRPAADRPSLMAWQAGVL